MKYDKIYNLSNRKKIYDCILKNPGLHEREIARKLKIPLTTVDYHVHLLERKNLITSVSCCYYKQYFATQSISSKDKNIIVILRRKAIRKVLLFLIEHNYSNHKKIHQNLKLAPSTVSFHLNTLLKLDIVKRYKSGRETIYWVIEPNRILSIMLEN